MSMFYLITEKYVIGDTDLIDSSENTIDVLFSDLIKNRTLLERLELTTEMMNNYDAFNWYAFYINELADETKKERYHKLKTNPIVRIVFIK